MKYNDLEKSYDKRVFKDTTGRDIQCKWKYTGTDSCMTKIKCAQVVGRQESNWSSIKVGLH